LNDAAQGCHLRQFDNTLSINLLEDVLADMAVHPGGASRHHAYFGGLIIHTAEVVKMAQIMAPAMGASMRVVTIAGIMHDWGKIFDYTITGVVVDSKPVVKKTPGYQTGNHIIRSYDKWGEFKSMTTPAFHEKVGRCILSHHGEVAWGAVVTPTTPDEWCLHLADMVSAQSGVALWASTFKTRLSKSPG